MGAGCRALYPGAVYDHKVRFLMMVSLYEFFGKCNVFLMFINKVDAVFIIAILIFNRKHHPPGDSD